MRCKACNKNLSDAESTRKSMVTDEYLDLCDHCLETIEEDIYFTQGDGENDGTTGPEEETEGDCCWGGGCDACN